MKAGAQFETKGVSEAIPCLANQAKMSHKEIHTADLHSGSSWGSRSSSGVTWKFAEHDFLIHGEKLLIAQTFHVVPEFCSLSQIISMTVLQLLLISWN